MSISTQNFLRMIGSGYGGGQSADPYSIYSALLGESAGELQTKKYNDQFALEKEKFGESKRQFDVSENRLQSQLDNMIKEANTRTTLSLADKGFGKESELNKFGQTYGLSYDPASKQIGTGLVGGGSSGGGGGVGGSNLESLLKMYQQIAPYATRVPGSRVNIYDPTLGKMKQNLSESLLRYTR